MHHPPIRRNRFAGDDNQSSQLPTLETLNHSILPMPSSRALINSEFKLFVMFIRSTLLKLDNVLGASSGSNCAWQSSVLLQTNYMQSTMLALSAMEYCMSQSISLERCSVLDLKSSSSHSSPYGSSDTESSERGPSALSPQAFNNHSSEYNQPLDPARSPFKLTKDVMMEFDICELVSNVSCTMNNGGASRGVGVFMTCDLPTLYVVGPIAPIRHRLLSVAGFAVTNTHPSGSIQLELQINPDSETKYSVQYRVHNVVTASLFDDAACLWHEYGDIHVTHTYDADRNISTLLLPLPIIDTNDSRSSKSEFMIFVDFVRGMRIGVHGSSAENEMENSYFDILKAFGAVECPLSNTHFLNEAKASRQETMADVRNLPALVVVQLGFSAFKHVYLALANLPVIDLAPTIGLLAVVNHDDALSIIEWVSSLPRFQRPSTIDTKQTSDKNYAQDQGGKNRRRVHLLLLPHPLSAPKLLQALHKLHENVRQINRITDSSRIIQQPLTIIPIRQKLPWLRPREFTRRDDLLVQELASQRCVNPFEQNPLTMPRTKMNLSTLCRNSNGSITRPFHISQVKLLVAEHDSVDARILDAFLSSNNIAHLNVETGRDVVRQQQESHFDVILFNMYLPDISGIEIARIIRRRERRHSLGPDSRLKGWELPDARNMCKEFLTHMSNRSSSLTGGLHQDKFSSTKSQNINHIPSILVAMTSNDCQEMQEAGKSSGINIIIQSPINLRLLESKFTEIISLCFLTK